MTTMTTQDWINEALNSRSGVWDIGQIDKPTAKALNKLVAEGVICKSRGSFHGISPLKTIWHKPSAVFPIFEDVTLHTAIGAALAELNSIPVVGMHIVSMAA